MKFIQPTMNPVDVVILVKLALHQEPLPQVKLAQDLFISQSEVSKSLARSRYAGLLDSSGKKVMHKALLDFLPLFVSSTTGCCSSWYSYRT